MRSLAKVLILVAAGCASQPAAPPGPKKYDLSTPEKRAAAVRDAAGIEAKHMSNCVRDAESFPSVVLVGRPGGYDQGCLAKGYFIDGVYVASRDEARAGLGPAWENPSKREPVARMWLQDAFGVHLVDTAGSDKPVMGVDSSGALVFDGWDEGSADTTGCFAHMRVRVSPGARFSFETFEAFRGCY